MFDLSNRGIWSYLRDVRNESICSVVRTIWSCFCEKSYSNSNAEWAKCIRGHSFESLQALGGFASGIWVLAVGTFQFCPVFGFKCERALKCGVLMKDRKSWMFWSLQTWFRTIGNNNKNLIDPIWLFVEKERYCDYLSLEDWSLRF